MNRQQLFRSVIMAVSAVLVACGGAHSPWTSGSNATPGAVVALAGNAGDTVLSLGWQAPTTGSAPFSYSVQLANQGAAQIVQSGTSAIVSGLANGTSYTLSVHATNSAGDGPTSTIQLTPSTVDSASYSALSVTGNTSGNDSSGISDPTLLLAGGALWMTYSSDSYYGTPLTKDVSVSLAYSNDGGTTFNYTATLGSASAATVTDSTGTVCGNTTCSGRWVYGKPFLVDDAGDPDTSRRFKVFAHKYFLYPSANPSTIYTLGSIVMWTAPTLNGSWSAELSVLGWKLTPPQLTPNTVVNTLDPALSACSSLDDGSATTFNGALDFVFACNTGSTQNIVLLRSTDHANSFSYVGTLLQATDASTYGANYFGAPSLITTETNAQLLMVTPVGPSTVNGTAIANAYSGCVAFPIASEQNASLFLNGGGAPMAMLQIPAITNQLSGACAWESGAGGLGVLLSAATVAPYSFGIVNTQKSF